MPDASYSARAVLPVFLTRDRDNAIGITIVDVAGDTATISSGTISVYDSNGVAVVDAAAVTVSPATYTVLAAVLPTTESFSDSWFIIWTLVIGGVTYKFNQATHLVRSTLKNPVTEADLLKRHPELPDLIAASDDVSDLLNDAWEWTQRRLLQDDRMPWRILDSFKLFDTVRFKTWADCFRSGHASVGGTGKYLEMADFYDAETVTAFAGVSVRYDSDDDGLPDPGDEVSAQAAVYMGGPGAFWTLG